MGLEPGAVLQERYRVARLLGQGGMGAVYRVWDLRLKAPRALKEMAPQPGIAGEMLADLRSQFRQEAQILGRLSHPNLVSVTDYFEEEGNAYLVMDFVEGESLDSVISREGSISETQVLNWAGQLLSALVYCHERGIIHRDIKPQNVIVRPDGQIILVDFGLVKLWNPNDPRTQTVMRGLGTPQYAPPEQYDAQTRHTDARSDIYSIGATLYHALTGQVPPTATMRIVNPKALVPIRQLNPRVSPHLESVLMRALALQPEARFQSVQEMLANLTSPFNTDAVIAPLPGNGGVSGTAVMPGNTPPIPSVSMTGAGAPSRKPFPWRYMAWGAGIIALLVLSGLALSNLLGGGTEPATPTDIAEATTTATHTPEKPTAVHTPTGTTLPADDEETPAPTQTAEPTATAAVAPTSTSMPTPVSTSTPTPPLPPTPTSTPACPAVTGPFAGLWSSRQSRLGCAANSARVTWTASEWFQGGRMLWRQDRDYMYVLYSGGSWSGYANTWREGDPPYSCPESAPSQTPPTPLRGFGKIWCSYSNVRAGLGEAVEPETGFDSTLQDFDRGVIFQTSSGTTYILYADGSWE